MPLKPPGSVNYDPSEPENLPYEPVPHTRAWDETQPTDEQLASSIDDVMRQLMVDIRERMDNIFEGWAGTDPVVLRQGALGSVEAKQVVVPHWMFQPTSEGVALVRDVTGTRTTQAAQGLFAGVVLPPGITITKVEFLVNKADVASVICKLESVGFSEAPDTQTHAELDYGVASGWRIADLGAITNPVVARTRMYYLTADSSGSSTEQNWYLGGARITYDVPTLGVGI